MSDCYELESEKRLSERKSASPLLMDVSALRVVECVLVSQCFPFPF